MHNRHTGSCFLALSLASLPLPGLPAEWGDGEGGMEAEIEEDSELDEEGEEEDSDDDDEEEEWEDEGELPQVRAGAACLLAV